MRPGRIVFFFLTFVFLRSVAVSADLTVAEPHLIPALDEVMRLNQVETQPYAQARPNGCPTDGAPPDSRPAFVHEEPDWRKSAKLPTLLTDQMYTYEQVCQEARKQNEELVKDKKPPRKFALVLGKMHVCDYGSGACIHAARTFFDPCNKFIADNFIPFHARTLFDGGQRPDASREMLKLYENPSGPRFVAIDLETCKPLNSSYQENDVTYDEVGIPANSDRRVDGVSVWKMEDRTTRFDEMRARLQEYLAQTPGARAKIAPEEWTKPIGCPPEEKVPVVEWPWFIPYLRILMNEQYEQVTGKIPAAKIHWPKAPENPPGL